MTTPTDAQIQEATKLYQSLLQDGYRDGQGITDLANLIAARDENRELKKDKERLDVAENLKTLFYATSECVDWSLVLAAFRPPKFGHKNNQSLREALDDAAISAEINSVKNI